MIDVQQRLLPVSKEKCQMYCSTTYIITHHAVLWRLFIVDLIVLYLYSLG